MLTNITEVQEFDPKLYEKFNELETQILQSENGLGSAVTVLRHTKDGGQGITIGTVLARREDP